MNNKQLAREISEFMKIRQNWIDILVRDPENSSAASSIFSINAKLELLRIHWNWYDETVEMPYRWVS